MTEHADVIVPRPRGDRALLDAEFARFVRAASPELGRVAWFLTGDETRAQDLLQSAFVRTYLSWQRVRQGDPLAYTRRVMTHARIDSWRKHRRELLTAPEHLPEGSASSHEDAHADRDRLTRALLTLTARQRRIVVLRHLVGLPEAEVAAELGVSIGTVKSTASRGLRQLREILGPLSDAARVADPGPPDPVSSPARTVTASPDHPAAPSGARDD